MKRREVLRASAAAVVTGLVGCGGGGGGGDGGSSATCTTNGIKSGTIDDPAHSFTAPAADVAAGATKTYSIKGSASHDHSITLTSGHFAQLKDGKSVSTTSTITIGHMHTVQVVCA